MFVYLSPSNQIGNTYYGNNHNECFWCEQIAQAAYDALIRSHVKAFLPDSDSMYARIADANAKVRDLKEPMLYVPIHTNATGLKNSTRRGTNIYNYGTAEGKRLATCIYNAVMDIPGAAVGLGGTPKNQTWYEMKTVTGIVPTVNLSITTVKRARHGLPAISPNLAKRLRWVSVTTWEWILWSRIPISPQKRKPCTTSRLARSR